MSFLARIPLLGWFLFSVAYSYAVWNPLYSAFDVLAGDFAFSTKAIVLALVLAVGALYFVEGRKAFSLLGLVVLFGLIGAIVWSAYDRGASFAFVQWWGQIVVGGLLTLALRWGQVYREMTGRVPVSPEPHHADAPTHHGGSQ